MSMYAIDHFVLVLKQSTIIASFNAVRIEERFSKNFVTIYPRYLLKAKTKLLLSVLELILKPST